MIGVREPLPGIIYPPAERLKAYVEAGELPTTSLIEELIASFARHADRPALCTPSAIVSYAELDGATDRFAAALIGQGLRPLDRVLFQAGNSLELVVALIACLKAGLVPTCTLPAHREREIGYLGRHVDARAHIVQGDDAKFDLIGFALAMQPETPTIKTLISLRGQPRDGVLRMEDMIDGEDRDAARAKVAAIPRDAFQVAIFQLSGGTTGVPKIIPRMQNDYLLNATLTADTLGYRPDDVMFMPMPIIHNACMICFLMPTLLTGAAFVIAEDMTPAAWADAFRRAPPTVIGLIRALMPRLEAALESAPVLDGVRFFWSADAARLLREKYGKPAYAMFGMSEGMNMYCRQGDPDAALDWTVGRPMSRFDEVKLVAPGTLDEVADDEIGEMIVRGPYTLSGYYNAPERNRETFTADGFYKPGDLLVRRLIDGEHYFAFAGRTKDVVDRGTEKINCEEVEGAVSTHAAVGGCAVVGMPDPVLGERVCAYVVLRGAHAVPAVSDLQEHLRGIGLAKFKWPERVVVVDALPLTKVGKLDKAALRTDIADRQKREAAASGGIKDATMLVKDMQLNGVHHTARPTWKLKETVEFYRDVLGLKLVHCVSARGWGKGPHPDFLHFFFDSGNGSTIAFFYYLGDNQPNHLVHRPHYDSDAIHTAWRVDTREQLMDWRDRLEAKGVEIMYQIEHEVVESIYFRDPNGYYIEIGRPLREFTPIDSDDAELTLAAALQVEAERAMANERLRDIESVWKAKGALLEARFA